MENLRETRQREFADIWMKHRFGLLLLSPRFGKTAVGINIFIKLDPSSILIVYPDEKIKQSWLDEFERMNYLHPDITFTTYLSLHKYKEMRFDIVVLDEAHLMSERQLFTCYELLKINKTVLALTGTLTKDTQRALNDVLHLPVLATYSISEAVEENIVADYEISIISVPLDNIIKLYKGKTEKQKFDNISWVIDRQVEQGKDPFFLRLQRMRIIQNSIAKKNKTISLLKEYEKERVLTFCGLTKVADSLGIPSYHSKSSEKNIFENFVKGDINHLAVCRIGNTGITYKSLNRVIVNYTDSNPSNLTQKLNRCLSMEYNNPDKKGLITIVSSDESTEHNWIKKGLSFFDKSKIKYL